MITDLFAGPGGWGQGAAMIGRRDTIGLEWDSAACRLLAAHVLASLGLGSLDQLEAAA